MAAAGGKPEGATNTYHVTMVANSFAPATAHTGTEPEEKRSNKPDWANPDVKEGVESVQAGRREVVDLVEEEDEPNPTNQASAMVMVCTHRLCSPCLILSCTFPVFSFA